MARLLRAGDLVILDGPLGAGKTTFTQGIGRGLAVQGAVTSPTFVIARQHRGPGPDLVHVDAYRLAGVSEVEDLDLDADLDQSVTVVEWGVGRVEALAEDRLEVRIERAEGGADVAVPESAADGPRRVLLHPVGSRWEGMSPIPI